MIVDQILRFKGANVVNVNPEASLVEAARQLKSGQFGVLVITDDDSRITGIISERDIVNAVAERSLDALALRVSDVMTRKVVTCSRRDTVKNVMEIMTQRKIRHVPVTDDDDRLSGIVSIRDVVDAHLAQIQLESDAMRQMITGR
jgi:CBS domain-containing protein